MTIPPVTTSGLQAAERCGRDFVLVGMKLADLPTALSFCEHPLEVACFMAGFCQEMLDLQTVTLEVK